jgi:hypothetical protein
MSKLGVISFGQRGYYYSIAKDVVKRIQRAYPLSKVKVFSEKDLPKRINRIANNHPRGYGYWLWKPYIINKMLSQMDNDDVVLYVDGRSHFIGSKILWLEEFIDSAFDVLVFELDGKKEIEYTNNRTLKLLNLKSLDILESNQFAAGILLIRKTEASRELIKEWLKISINHHELFMDDLSSLENKDFRKHRHDQSVFSCLIKKSSTLKIKSMSFNTLNTKDSLLTHYKTHSSWRSRFHNLIRIYFPNRYFEKLMKVWLIIKKKI